MKKTKFLLSVCMAAVLFVSQCAWAAAGDKTTTSTFWKEAGFNGTITPQRTSKVTAPDGFVSFEISGDKGVTYTTSYHTIWASNKPRLEFGDLERHGNINGAITATPLQDGYTFVWTRLTTNTAACGANGYFYLGHESETYLANAAGGTSESSTENFADYNDSVPFRFHRTGLSIVTYPAWMVRMGVEYQIIPNAPTWKNSTDVMDVTVDNVNGQHYYNLANNIQVANSAFAGTVKYEIIGNNAEYVYWNGDHTAFYVLKPGTYTVKAYIEKEDGKYCSSAYTEELTINATTKEEDKAKAKIYFYMDGQMVEEIDPINHIWNAVISINDKEEHYLEYVSGLTDLITVIKSDRHLSYQDDTDLWGDHFMLKGTAGIDSVKVIQNGKNAWLAIKIDRMGSNHLPYTINSAEQFANQTIVVRAEKTQWDAEHNDIQFNGVGTTEDIATTRTIEFAFTGIPDSVMFTYNTNARVNRGNVRLTLSYAVTPGNWVEVARVTAPDGPEPQYDKACAYAIPANAKYVQLQYFNAQYTGWVRDFTITEKKAITFPQDTLVITGVHTPGGVATQPTSLNWYNVLDSLDWGKGMADADMFDVQSSKIPTALDQYKENIPYAVQYKLDEPGIHYANIMFWGQDKDEKGKFTTIAYYTVKGVTAYNKEEVVIETPSLPEDTTTLQKGDTLANPFVVKDTLGNELPKDSVNYKYEISPEGGVTIDENGNIIPQCVGTTRIIAMLQPNTLVPAKADTIFIYVAEESKNVIKWNLPETIAKGDTLPAALASTEDEAEMTYEFIPATAVEEVTGGYQVMQAGAFQIVAKAAQTCDHFAMDSTVNVYANGVVGSIELNSTVDPLNLNVLDTIKNMFVVLGESGDTLDAPEANITYAIEPAENMHLDENGNFVVDRSGDVKVTVTVAGDTLKPATQEFNFKLKAVKEQIFDNMLDTLLLGKDYTYDLKNYFTTLSPLGIDSVSVPKTYEGIVDINGCVVTPVSKGVVRLIVTAKGNDDFTGPVEKVHEITVVGVVKEINWNEALKEELEEPRVGDVIHTGDVPVYDEEGHQIPPEQVERTYVINPEGAAHVTPEGDLVVDLPIDPITVVVTTEVEGMETKIDTITIHGKPASISEIELPEEVVKGEAHIGDIVSLDNVKVYDQNGKDITDQIDKIEYIIEPEGVAHIDENGNLVIDKAEPFTITTKVTDPLVDPEKSSYVTPVTVAPFQVNEVTIPEIPTDLNPGDVLDMNDVKVYDKDGKDITDKCKVEYTFEPEGSAQYNPNTGEIEFIKASEITVKTTISGEGVETKTIDTKVNVDAFTPATDFKLPEPEEGFHAGDIIPVEILDENGERINDFVDIDVKINPADKAEYNPETGEITIKEGVEGPVDVTITVGGDNVQPAITYTETIYVHHDETGCYDYMVQLWNDVAIINNNNETASFVRYEWYKDGKLVAGQNSQDYHEANGAAMNGIYYAYAYDEAGNKFMICEKEFNGAAVAEIVKPSPVVIPTIMAPGRTYTIETADEGQVVIMNTNGAVMDNFNVKAGVNTQIAPASSGVFILQYTATDGQAKACKLIVK